MDQIKEIKQLNNTKDNGLLHHLFLYDPGRRVWGWSISKRGVLCNFEPNEIAKNLEKKLSCRAIKYV